MSKTLKENEIKENVNADTEIKKNNETKHSLFPAYSLSSPPKVCEPKLMKVSLPF